MKQNHDLMYIYYFLVNEYKINIKFDLLNKGNFIVNFYINDIESGDKYEIKKSKTIELKKSYGKIYVLILNKFVNYLLM